MPVRVLLSDETVNQQRVEGRNLKVVTTLQHWVWLSTVCSGRINAKVLWQLGHLRWKNENNCWDDLTKNWTLKQRFLQTYKHRVKLIQPGQDDKVSKEIEPTRGLRPWS